MSVREKEKAAPMGGAGKKSLAERIASLTPEQRALYESRRRQLQQQDEKPRIPRLEGRGPWPATTDQSALWFIQQLEPSTSAYNIGNGFRMKGALNVPLLERCLNEVAERHQILRSVFTAIDGQPCQVVTDMRLTAPVIDVSGAADPEAAARAEVSRLIREPFDLEKGPLVRLPLVRIADADHVFVGLLHHIVTDWWSYYVFYTELFGLYHAYSQGRPSPFRELPIQYADWAAWRGRWEKTEAFNAQEDYWLRQVKDVPCVLEVPADRPRPPVQSHRGARAPFEVPGGVTPRLRALNRRAGTSSFMTLLAALDVFLWRYSGEERFLVGTPVSADRDTPETASLIGYMLNTLVLRADLSGNPSFLELLERVRETCMGAFANKEYPFRHLVQRLNLERDMSRMPLYQIEYLYISTESPLQHDPGSVEAKVELPGFEISAFGIDRQTSPVDLQITFGESHDRFDVMFEYNTDIFDAGTVHRMARHLIGLLDSLSARPEQPLAAVPMLSDEERRHLLEDLNPAARPLPEEFLPGLLEAQAARTPGAVALECSGNSLSYADLNCAANRLAHHLISMRAGPGSIVGICIDRSLEMLVAMLAVLKSGAAYLPLDPEFPEARLAYMLEDSAPAAVVTTEPLRSRMPESARLLLLDADELKAVLGQAPDSNPQVRLHAGDAAYVIYTSGSTGKPKGTVISHHALAAFLNGIGEHIAFNAGHVHLAVTTIGFDISILELFMPLCHGARVVLASRDDARDAAALSRLVRSSGANSMQATPSHWLMLLDAGRACLNGLRVLSGGEALPRETAVALCAAAGEVYNVYGPTEATVWASVHRLSGNDLGPEAPDVVTIGKPFVNYRMYVLDHCLEPRSIGVAGDLYIAGEALAQGYLCRPSLTAERFVADPFAASGERMYRTGDLARWRADGTLEFLGRADQQIKLRGFRIELGEIEAALKALPEISQAAVIVNDGPGGKQIVAYLVAANGASSAPANLRALLVQRLPDYMVPSAFVMLDALPLTPNGKLDRRALPAPDRKIQAYRAPRTPDEEILCSIFAGILGLDRVGVDDNFFALGGHSLMATRLVSHVRDTLGVEIPLRSLFEAPTVGQLAPRVQSAEKARAPLVRRQRPERLPLSHGQQRLWFIDQLEGTSVQYNLPEVLRLHGEIDLAALKQTIDAIVGRHESLRTHFSNDEGEPRQIIEPELFIDLPVEDLSYLIEEEQRRRVSELLREEWERPFDLSRGPLLRVKILKLGKQDHLLLRTLHHIVSDGWSQGVFNREFMVVYEAIREGRGVPLPPLSVQYADFALWQREWVSEEALERELEYWKRQLAGIPEQLELPRDRPRQARRTYAAEVCSVTVPREQAAALLGLGHSSQATLYMTMLSAFAVLLSRYSGQGDIVVGSPIANRQQAQLEDLIGFFVNSLIMRVRVNPGDNFSALLAFVRGVCLEAYQHQDVPFERLVEELAPQRRLNAAPVFQVVFALQNAPMGPQRLKDLEVEPVGMTELRVRIDLELHAVERNGVIDLHWLYGRDLFDRWRMEQMARHYLRLLEAVAANPARPLAQIDLLGPDEYRQVLEEWNDSARPLPGLTLVQLFEAQAERTPEAAAVIFNKDRLTYAALNDRSNRLARLLIGRNVGPEDVVALAIPRSPEMIVGLLGILKAGAAYLPLDPNYPAERLLFMLRDSKAACLVTSGSIAAKFPGETHRIVLDAEHIVTALRENSGANISDEERIAPLHPQHPAYIIYTSGSTGVPKGVVVTHAGIPSLSATRAERLDLDSSSRVLQFASLSFDVSVVEIVQALTTGAALVLISEEQRTGKPLRDAVAENGVTHATLPPAVLPTLNDTGDLPLANLIVGGEACAGDLVVRWSQGRRMFNGYGPTETTVVATMAGPLSGKEPPAIGTPVFNTRVYILDESLRPSPVGVPGELYIAGASLARGYLDRRGLTAARFVASPFGVPGERMYRTGDLARWRSDGSVEFLGRTDQQIKIRGFRVELGEIEAALVKHPRVEDALVLLHEPGEGEKQLVGYVVARRHEPDQAEAQAAQVRHWQQFYDSFRRGLAGNQHGFAGWNSSYTGEPIPAAEMSVWLDQTIERLRALRPKRVVEVGCGAGLLLTRLAAACESYIGMDFSAEAINRLGAHLKERGDLPQVELRHGAADDLSFASDNSADLVIINSVVQYFPGTDYLLKAISEALRVTMPGGHIFVGDVRNLALQEAFYASVQLFRAAPETSRQDLLRKVNQAKLAEEELLIAPQLFHEIGEKWPKIGRVDVAPKAGAYDNEISRFRYDVTIAIGAKEQPVAPNLWLDWDAAGDWRREVRRMLAFDPQAAIGVRGIRDARSSKAVMAAGLLRSDSSSTAEEIRAACSGASGEDPNELISLAKECGVGLDWRGFTSEGTWDVVFQPQWEPAATDGANIDSSWSYYRRYANAPALNAGEPKLGGALQEHLRGTLPDYMVPSSIMVLPDWPLTPSGKIDRAALPAPERRLGGRRPPRTPQEEILCSIFAEVLAVDQVGVDDNFFALGGHSLLATRLVSQVRATLGVELPLRALFEAPTVEQLAPIVAGAGQVRAPLVPQPRIADLPLSYAQQRLWFIDQLEAGVSTEYNMPSALRLRGDLDLNALHRAIDAIMERHESLRTRFAQVEGEPVQIIDPPSPFDIPVDDLSGLDEATQRERALLALRQEWERPFDLARGPVLRMRLIRLGERDHLLLRTFHHIVSDGWSVGVFSREFMLLYEAFHEGRDNPLPPLPVQYADFALWQRQWLDHDALGRELQYWKKQLEGIPDQLDLPKDRPRTAMQAYAADVCESRLPVPQAAALRKLTHDSHATLYMSLLSAFAVLLHRYSGQQDIVVGSPIANRQDSQLEQMIGFFVNSLVMRTRVSPDMRFDELLGAVRAVALEAYQHQDVPFERLVEELAPERSLNRTPIFQVVFALQNAPMRGQQLKGLEIEPVGGDELRVRFDLELHVFEHGDELGFYWLYKKDLFERWRMEQMARHFTGLLESAVASPQSPLRRLEMLGPLERRMLLVDFNDTSESLPETNLLSLFEEQAARTPEAPAIVSGGDIVSFRVLNERANRLARYLIGRNIGPEDVVAIALERSTELIVAVLGVMKSGAAYLPLDLDVPGLRLQSMLKDAAPALVLCREHTRSRLPEEGAAVVVDGREYESALRQASPGDLANSDRKCPLLFHHPAYVIYTSGSTGVPKGVLVSHRGLMNYLRWSIREYGVQQGTGSPVHSSIAFDLTVTSIFPALLTGKPVLLASGQQNDVENLADVLRSRNGLSLVKLTPAHVEVLNSSLAAPQSQFKDRALALVIGGEALKYETLASFRDSAPETRLINEYGPTETVVGCCVYEVRSDDPASGDVPIGRPISNTRLYVLDGNLEPVPIGVPGELYIAGEGVARGYLRRPALTAERFVADLYGPPGVRMYRSGDLARRRPDGVLEFLGRADQQLKVRGYRIEPGEIEAMLRRHERVADALVLAGEHAGEAQLLGYAIARQSEAGEAQAQASQLEHWRQLYDSTYGESGPGGDFNLAGWKSSYTGGPIPPAEMRIWVEETVARIRELRPRRVLEIGCGTGLLLTRLAPGCESYIGLDFSREVLSGLAAYLTQRRDLSHVVLHQGLAGELSFLADDSVDLVVINSVVQYFPDVEYLLRVLAEAERVTVSGGHIFIGDVRSLPLLEAYHTSVALNKAANEHHGTLAVSVPLNDLRQRIELARQSEEELALDAELFSEFAHRSRKIGRAEAALKAGDCDNELTRFRYDVTLTLGARERLAEPDRWLPWDDAGRWKQELRRLLVQRPGESIGVRGLRDGRAAQSVEAVRILREGTGAIPDAAGLQAACAGVRGDDPNVVMQLAHDLGAGFCWRGFGSNGLFDAVFNPRWEPERGAGAAPRGYYRRYANTPAQTAGAVELGRELLGHLQQNLPGYMTPAAVMVLAAWPLTPNGKIDRRALPTPVQRQQETYRSPRTPQEELLCQMFGEVLGLARVGIDDNFFSLGGHSLLATRLAGQIRSALGVDLRIRTLFEAPTVAELVARLDVKTAPESAFEQMLPLRARGSRPPIFCAHPAGGLSWCYAGFMRELAPEQPIYGLQAAAVMGDGEFPAGIDSMAEEYVHAILNLQPAGPYYILGWSFGGIVAHEIACRLQQLGERVGLLTIMDTFPSVEGEEVSVETEEDVLRQLAGIIGLDLKGLEGRPLDFTTVYEAACHAGHVPADFDERVARRTMQMMLHNASLKQSFRSGRFDGDVLFFYATKKEGRHSLPEAWKPYVTGRIEVHNVDCKHFEMTDPGPVREIGRILEQHLKHKGHP